jgi:hypothetical protein
VQQYNPSNVEADKNKDINRMRAVIECNRARLGERKSELLDAIVLYWKAVSGIVQRQEHGGQRLDDALHWEDARRVVFQTAVLFFEVDRALAG